MVVMHSRARTRLLAGALAIGIVASLAGCGTSEADPLNTGKGAQITVGAQGSVQNRVIAQLYGQVLAEHGYLVDYNEGIGTRDAYIPALQAGTVDLVADNSGALLYAANSNAFQRLKDDVDDALPKAVGEYGLHVLETAPADDAAAFVVTDEYADQHQVASIGELGYLAKNIVLREVAEFENRRYGPAGLLSAYGLTGYATRTIIGDLPLVSDLLTGAVEVAVIPSTSPSIERNNLRVLADPKGLITAQNIVPLVNDAAYTDDVRALLDRVSEELTTEELQALNASSTETATPSPETIAKSWLTSKGLLVR
jgi:osmoprotectant transport system substrate-binding protein